MLCLLCLSSGYLDEHAEPEGSTGGAGSADTKVAACIAWMKTDPGSSARMKSVCVDISK